MSPIMSTARSGRHVAKPAALPRNTRLLLTGLGFSAVGDGILLPLIFFYLTRVQKISLSTASLIIAIDPLVAGLLSLFAGTLVDRWGPARVLRLSAVVQSAAVLLLAVSGSVPTVVVAIVIKSIGLSGYWPSSASLLVAGAPNLTRVFSLRFLAVNIGIGLGSAAAALVADPRHPATFTLLFIVDAATFLVLLGCAPRQVSGSANEPPQPADAATTDRGSFTQVLRDRPFTVLGIATFLLSTAGYGQSDAGIPALVTGPADLSMKVMGLALTVNTAAVVALQMTASSLLEKGRPTIQLGVVAVGWAGSWAVLSIAVAPPFPGTATAVMALVMSQLVTAVVETFLQPAHAALVNEMAPPSLRGRYNGVASFTWQVGYFLGPVLSGLALGAGASHAYLDLLILSCLVSAAMMVAVDLLQRRSRRRPAAHRRRQDLGAQNPGRAADRQLRSCLWY